MATFERRGKFWRVKIRRTGLPAQTRTFDSKTPAEILERYRREVTPTKRGAAPRATPGSCISWPLRSKRVCGGVSFSAYSGRTSISRTVPRSCRSRRTANPAACRFPPARSPFFAPSPPRPPIGCSVRPAARRREPLIREGSQCDGGRLGDGPQDAADVEALHPPQRRGSRGPARITAWKQPKR